MLKQPKQYDDDDGRTICNMDVDGMPWFNKRVRREESAARHANLGERITRSEARVYTWYALLAGLLIAAVFSVAIVLFTLFCTQIWFR